MIRDLRPTGNKIHFQPQLINENLFTPFHTNYYQSGTAALSSALIATKLLNTQVRNPRVLLPAYTCPDIISACLYAHVDPILVDLEPNKPWMAIESIQQKIETDPSIIAVIAINFLGISERVSEISKIIKNHNIVLIEDCAQGIPTSENNFSRCSDIIISSFGRGKPLGLLGGGIVITKQPDLANLLPKITPQHSSLIDKLKYRLKVSVYNIMIKPFVYFLLRHMPFLKLGETRFKPLNLIEACPDYILGLVNYNYHKYQTRKLLNNNYQEMLNRVNSSKIIDLPTVCKINMQEPLLRYPVLITDSNIHAKLQLALNNAGLGASVMYQKILPNIEAIDTSLSGMKGDFNNASKFAKQLLTFPTHEDVTVADIEKIESILMEVFA